MTDFVAFATFCKSFPFIYIHRWDEQKATKETKDAIKYGILPQKSMFD